MDNDDIKKTVYDKLLTKINVIDTKKPSTSKLITKAQYDSDKHVLEKKIEDFDRKIPNTSGQVKKTDYNTKITEMENKILNVTR